MTNGFDPSQMRAQADELERGVETVLDAITKLRQAADAVEAVSAEKSAHRNGNQKRKPLRRRKSPTGKPQTRLNQLREYLKKTGPSSRKDAKALSGLPSGTVNALLTAENFVKTEDGLWTAEAPK